ncbi:mitochondrial translation release factor in rescue [Lycorma delicatula]|uniref:mitochondrial translation release factor in rescue n=1 Tax=Lycorma delicatula TaxID=130591 RepID=UPI003F5135C3
MNKVIDFISIYKNTRSIFLSTANAINKKKLDYTNYPKLDEGDLSEQFVRGSGPGGQSVNKTANCVVLQHKPTGLVIKCHQTRSLDQNRKLARDLLVKKLDNVLNGEMSIEAQIKRLLEKKSITKDLKRKKLEELKSQWREREGLQ